jgi:hypothetical protein
MAARPWAMWGLGAVLVGLYAFQERFIDAAARSQHGIAAALSSNFIHSLPYPFVYSPYSNRGDWFVLFAIGLAQAAALFFFRRASRLQRPTLGYWGFLAISMMVMVAISLHARSLLSEDVYAYAGYAKLGTVNAYAPPAKQFAGEFADVNRIWGLPMVPSYYGPLWVALSAKVAGRLASLGAAIFSFRVLEIVPFIAIAAVFAMRDRSSLPLFILNPAIANLYIANGHNDLLPISCVVVATALAAGAPILAMGLVVIASLVKVPFALFALVAFAGRSALNRRLAWALATVIASIAAALLWGGMAYAHGLFSLAGSRGAAVHAEPRALVSLAIDRALLAIALAALLAVFVRGFIVRSASLAFMVLNPVVIYPWYTAWGLPYAAPEERAVAMLLIALPVISAALERAFPLPEASHAALAVVLAVTLIEIGAKGVALQRSRKS